MKLWLARHAQPLIDAGICYGASDVAADAVLTQTAAQSLASALACNLPQAIVCRISPLLRCQQLAVALQALRPDLFIESSTCTDPRLAEMDFGEFEGQPWATIPEAEVDAWTVNFGNHRFGGKECANDVLLRVASALRDEKNQLTESTKNTPKDSLWITHAGVIRAVSLLQQGITQVEHATQWPREVPAFGQWVCVEI